jgi:hypothetical protein
MTQEELLELGKDPQKLMAAAESFVKTLGPSAVELKDEIESRNVDLSLLAAGFQVALMSEGGITAAVAQLLKTVMVSAYLLGRQDESNQVSVLKQLLEPMLVTAGVNLWPKEED